MANVTNATDFVKGLTAVAKKCIWEILQMHFTNRTDLWENTEYLAGLHVEQFNIIPLRNILNNIGLIKKVTIQQIDKQLQMDFFFVCKPCHQLTVCGAYRLPCAQNRKFFMLAPESYSYEEGHKMSAQNAVWMRNIRMTMVPFASTTLLHLLLPGNITEIELVDCVSYDDELLPLSSCRKLISLNLACNLGLLGDRMPMLPKLKRLSLAGCEQFKEENFRKFVSGMQLEYLDIDGTYISNMKAYMPAIARVYELRVNIAIHPGVPLLSKLRQLHISEFGGMFCGRNLLSSMGEATGHQLECLKINGVLCPLMIDYQLSILKLTRLRTLHMTYVVPDPKFFNEIAYCLPNLEELLIEHSFVLTPQNGLTILQYCTRLQRVSFRYCRNIDNDFVFSAIDILNQRANLKRSYGPPVIMLVAGTSVYDNILLCEEYKLAQYLLELSFYQGAPPVSCFEQQSLFDACLNRKYHQ